MIKNKVYMILNYNEFLLILVSIITDCVSISVFALLVGLSIDIASSEVGLKVPVINV